MFPQISAPCEFEIPKRYESSERRESNNSNNLGNVDINIYCSPCGIEIRVDDTTVPDPPPLGSLSFETLYEEYDGQLKVHLISARRLPIRHLVSEVGVPSNGDVIPCDPIVSICLLPDEKPILESYVQYGTQKPEFDEKFVFKVVPTELNSKTLRFTVFDSKRQHVLSPIGHVLCSLKGHAMDGAMVVEKDIKPHSQVRVGQGWAG